MYGRALHETDTANFVNASSDKSWLILLLVSVMSIRNRAGFCLSFWLSFPLSRVSALMTGVKK